MTTKRRKRWRVGFYTAKHPVIDERIKGIGSTIVVLWSAEILAHTHGEAIAEAKRTIPVRLIKTLVQLRWENTKSVGYTWDRVGRHPSTWGRVEGSVKFETLEELQREGSAS